MCVCVHERKCKEMKVDGEFVSHRYNKRYFMIDQQTARHSVQFSECRSNPP